MTRRDVDNEFFDLKSGESLQVFGNAPDVPAVDIGVCRLDDVPRGPRERHQLGLA